MVKYISAGLLAVALLGCGEASVEEVVIDRNETSFDSGSVVVLDENQSIGYKPNTDVTIVNIGDNSYYIECAEGECPVHIDNSSVVESNNSTEVVEPTAAP